MKFLVRNSFILTHNTYSVYDSKEFNIFEKYTDSNGVEYYIHDNIHMSGLSITYAKSGKCFTQTATTLTHWAIEFLVATNQQCEDKPPKMIRIKQVPYNLKKQNWEKMNFHNKCEATNALRKEFRALLKKYDCPKYNWYIDWAIDDPSMLSYISRDRQKRFNYDYWNKDLRAKYAYMGKIGKVLKKIFPKITICELEEITHKFATNKIDFELVGGDDIQYYYHEDQYANECGTLGDSCMRHDSCQSYFGVYKDNCQMLVALDDSGQVHGRALIWEEVDFRHIGKKTFMDRIYYNSESVLYKFKNHAILNDFVYKQHQNFSDKTAFIYQNKAFCMRITVPLIKPATEYEEMPYIDTFTYTDGGECELRNSSGDVAFESTDGTFEMGVWSDCENRYIDEYECVSINDGNDVCHCENAVEIDGKYYHIHDEYIVTLANREYALEENTTIIDGKYYHIHDDGIVYVDRLNEYILLDDATYTIDEVYEPSDDCVFCESEQVFILICDAYELTFEYKIRYFTSEEKAKEYYPEQFKEDKAA